MLHRMAPPLSDLWVHRGLLWQFTLRNVELRHKGSHLGLVWSFLQPLLMLGLYVFVFGYIFQGHFGVLPNETRMEYGLGIFLGLSLYHFFTEVLVTAPALIVSTPNFVKKVVFPLEILPAASVGAASFHFIISLTMVCTGLLLFGPGFQTGMLWLPVIITPLVFLGLGISWLFSALGVFLRDIAQLLQFLSTALMFASAVFYSATKIPPSAWAFLRFNPLLLAIELARDTALWQRAINIKHLVYIYGVGIVVCLLGYHAFRKMKPAFADVL